MADYILRNEVLDLLNDSNLHDICHEEYVALFDAVDTMPAETVIELPATVGDIAIAHSKETDSLEAFIITVATLRLYDTQDGYTVAYKAVQTGTSETIEFSSEDIGFGKKVVIGSLHVEGGL